jgi:hypothetical protein
MSLPPNALNVLRFESGVFRMEPSLSSVNSTSPSKFSERKSHFGGNEEFFSCVASRDQISGCVAEIFRGLA